MPTMFKTVWEGHYFDGRTAARHEVKVSLMSEGLHIEKGNGTKLWWTYGELRQTQGSQPGDPIRLERGREIAEALVVEETGFLQAIEQVAPRAFSRFRGSTSRPRMAQGCSGSRGRSCPGWVGTLRLGNPGIGRGRRCPDSGYLGGTARPINSRKSRSREEPLHGTGAIEDSGGNGCSASRYHPRGPLHFPAYGCPGKDGERLCSPRRIHSGL